MSHVGRRAGTLRPRGRGRQATSKALIVLAIVATGLIAAPIGLSYYLAKASGKDRPPLDLASLHMVNYYPSGGGWKYQWTRFDPAGIDADLTRARSIGANTIRIFLLPGAMGYPKPQPVMLARLEQLLTIAARHHLRVGISLFDGFHRYGDRDGSAAWAKAVLEPHSHDSRIAFVEVQNEIDPDNPAAMDWLRATLPVVRSLAPGVPDTVSAPGAGGAARLARLRGALGSTLPDFFDFHYFGGPEWAASTFAGALQAAGSVPLLIGETGYSTDPANPRAPGVDASVEAQEDWQAHYLSSVEYAARALGLPPAAPWTLTDFAPGAIPASMRLSRRPEQYHYGLFRVDGRPKPAAAVVRRAFIKGQIETSFHAGFEQPLDTPRGPVPLGWRVWDDGAASFAWDDSTAHSGRASARISASGGSGSMVPAFFSSPVDDSVVTGSLYVATVWARGSAASGDNNISIAWYDAQHHYLGQTRSLPLPPGDTPWIELRAAGRPPALAAAYQVHLKSFGNTGTVWFDDVSVG